MVASKFGPELKYYKSKNKIMVFTEVIKYETDT